MSLIKVSIYKYCAKIEFKKFVKIAEQDNTNSLHKYTDVVCSS